MPHHPMPAPLTLAYPGPDQVRFAEIGKRLPSDVNGATPQDGALAPFGGIGQSGLGGRSGGDSNIEEFTERRWLTVTPGPAHYPY